MVEQLKPVRSQNCMSRPDPPAKVSVLFIGESPPASGRNFYRADSGLYRAIHEAFIAAGVAFDADDFLKVFLRAGCYFIDLCPKPVDRLPAKDRVLAHRAGEAQLSEAISRLRPEAIIVVVRSIEANVHRAIAQAHWRGPFLSLPYPGRWASHKAVFVSSIQAALPGLLPGLLNRLAPKRKSGKPSIACRDTERDFPQTKKARHKHL